MRTESSNISLIVFSNCTFKANVTFRIVLYLHQHGIRVSRFRLLAVQKNPPLKKGNKNHKDTPKFLLELFIKILKSCNASPLMNCPFIRFIGAFVETTQVQKNFRVCDFKANHNFVLGKWGKMCTSTLASCLHLMLPKLVVPAESFDPVMKTDWTLWIRDQSQMLPFFVAACKRRARLSPQILSLLEKSSMSNAS